MAPGYRHRSSLTEGSTLLTYWPGLSRDTLEEILPRGSQNNLQTSAKAKAEPCQRMWLWGSNSLELREKRPCILIGSKWTAKGEASEKIKPSQPSIVPEGKQDKLICIVIDHNTCFITPLLSCYPFPPFPGIDFFITWWLLFSNGLIFKN